MSLIFGFAFGGYEVLIVAGVILLLFGGKKIPELMRGLGRGVQEFKGVKDDIESEIKSNIPNFKDEK